MLGRRDTRAIAGLALSLGAGLAAPAASGAAPLPGDDWTGSRLVATATGSITDILGGEDAGGRLVTATVKDVGAPDVELTMTRKTVAGGPGDAQATIGLQALERAPFAAGLGPRGELSVAYTVTTAPGTMDVRVATMRPNGTIALATVLSGELAGESIVASSRAAASLPLAFAATSGHAVRAVWATATGWHHAAVPNLTADLVDFQVATDLAGDVAIAGVDATGELWAARLHAGAWTGADVASLGPDARLDSVAVNGDGRVLIAARQHGGSPDAWVGAPGGLWIRGTNASDETVSAAFDERGPVLLACEGNATVYRRLVGQAWTDVRVFPVPYCAGTPLTASDGRGWIVAFGSQYVRHRPGARALLLPVGTLPLPADVPVGATASIGRVGELLLITLGGQQPRQVRVQVYGSPPTVTTPPVVVGSGRVGTRLTCRPGTAVLAVATAAWWLRDGRRVAAASRPYAVARADVRHRLACVAVRSNAVGAVSTTSAAVVGRP